MTEHDRTASGAPVLGEVVIVKDAAGRILLVRYSYKPGGGLEPGEMVQDAALRELAEKAEIAGYDTTRIRAM